MASITLPNNPNVGILSAVVSKAPVIALDEGFESIVLATTHLTGVDVMALTIANESNIGAGGGPLTFFFADQPEQGSTTSPPTYTTKQVTVPMGQQTTIAYVAPDSTSQMTFYVQKADGTCVGTTCSTYLTDWADGSGSSVNWAANLSPSLNSQIEAGQHWTMTIQNAGLGYNGYLSSPSGRGIPAASGSTPAGAQFKLMTQNEINDQQPWAVALEKIVGEAIAIVGITILTAGTGDAAVLEEESTELLLKEGENGTEIGSQGGQGESVRSDPLPDNLENDREITEAEGGDIFMNLSDDYLSESSIVERDSINDIKDLGFDSDTFMRSLARSARRRVV